MRPRSAIAGLALLLLAVPAAAQEATVPAPDAAAGEAAPAKPTRKLRPKPKPGPAAAKATAGSPAKESPAKDGAAKDPAKTEAGPPDLSTLDLSTPDLSTPDPGAEAPGAGASGASAFGRGSGETSSKEFSKESGKTSGKTDADRAGPGSLGGPRSEKPDGDGGNPPAASGSGAAEPAGTSAALKAAPAAPTPQPVTPERPLAPPPLPSSVAPPATGAVVACEPGQAILYDGPNGFSFWVTRSGAVTIDNPLRPLTPDVTRVLRLVIADKLATLYGPDLAVLRRGAAPGAMESLLGGPIRWEATLGTLPDALDIVTDSGAPLALMRFKECGTAPAVAAPVAGKEPKARPRKAASQTRPAPGADTAGLPAVSGPGTAQSGAAPRRFNMPQGAIPE